MTEVDQLLAIMARLRGPDGCPWDRKQDFKSIAPYTIEEAYEVADAIDRGDVQDIQDELGDLLLQVVFHAQMAREAGHFQFSDVVSSICDKMRRRHPHVFGDATVDTADAQQLAWEAHKANERQADSDQSALAGVAAGLPEWLRAEKLTRRAASVGFDWPDARSVIDKVAEETAELQHEMDSGGATGRLEEELGDLMFSVVNLARKLKIDSGGALRRANGKFERRFRDMEARATERGQVFAELSQDEQERLWQEAKDNENAH